MKKVVFIDWYKTLSYSRFWEHLEDSKNPNSHYYEAIKKWLFVEHKDLIEPWMRGEISTEEVLRAMSRDTGIGYGVLLNELKYSCDNMAICLPNIKELVDALHAIGAKTVIATDNMDTFRKYTVPALKLDRLFDDILVSNEQGVLKNQAEPPHAIAFFDEYLKSKGLGYSDAILLDDYPDSSGKYMELQFDRILISSPEELEESLTKIAAQ